MSGRTGTSCAKLPGSHGREPDCQSTHRQWLVRRFNLWDSELGSVEELLVRDVRNNSAWNHRYFVIFGSGSPVTEEIIDREIE